MVVLSCMGRRRSSLLELHLLPFQVRDFSLSHSRLQSYDDDRSDVIASINEHWEKSSLFHLRSLDTRACACITVDLRFFEYL